MSSPSKKSAQAIEAKNPKAAKSDGSEVRKIFRKINSYESDESPVQSQSSADSVLVGRSGRVRKAKVVFDPSDMEVGMKRKSWAAIYEGEAKPKKAPKTSDIKKEVVEQPEPSLEASKKIVQRRKTVGAPVTHPATDEHDVHECIVCGRSDIKKGRFVICIHCPTRGHFTCLRNARYLGSAPEEKHWQCTDCLKCTQCNDPTKTENLFKCTLCYMSFHLTCLKERSRPVTKKRFKCDDCMSVTQGDDNEVIADDDVEMNKSETLTKKSPGNGFAGFSQEETNKSTASSCSSSSADNSHSQQSPPEPEHRRKASLTKSAPLQRSSSSKSATYSRQSPSLFDSDDKKTDLKTEPEARSPTPDAESTTRSTFRVRSPTHLNTLAAWRSKPSYGTDDSENELEKRVDIRYDRRTQIRPHESIPDVKKWDCDEVYTYFMGTTTAEYAHLFRENQIDGDALLLIKREDVLNRFNLKLGPALRLYSHIVTLQYKNNNPILAWDED